MVEGLRSSLQNVTVSPTDVVPGGTFTMTYTLTAAPAFDLMLGASIAPVNTTNYISDPPNDNKVSVTPGSNQVTRSFTVPAGTAPGFYDVLATLYYDTDNNNQINTGDFRMDRVRYSLLVSVGVTGIERVDNVIPGEFALEQNYPNPFNPSTTFTFQLAEYSTVSLRVFDLIGKEVASIVDEDLAAGRYQADWDASALSSGIYFYRLEATGSNGANFLQTRKLILSR